MTKVDMEIVASYLRDGSFEEYSLDCNYDGGGFWSRGLLNVEGLAGAVLNCILKGVKNPRYNIILSEGVHPLRGCSLYCKNNHYGYTAKPDESLKSELEHCLNDSKLIAEAKERAEWSRRHPITIAFQTPHGLIEYKGDRM